MISRTIPTTNSIISELYERTCFAVTDNPVNWQSFLKTAGRNFRLRFDEQLLIYAQRPDATAVLEIERWNGTFGRWVNRGAKGIVGYKTFQNVLHLWEGEYENRTAQSFYDWGVIAQHFEAMRLLGELTDTMKPIRANSSSL